MFVITWENNPAGDILTKSFTNHETAAKEGGHFLNSALLLPPASQSTEILAR